MQTPTPRVNKTKTCAFCKKSPPDVKISREHVIRKKIRTLFPEFRGMSLHQFNSDRETGNSSHNANYIPQSPYELQVNDVCKTCNEGWMEKLEVEAEKYLFPLFSGKKTRLSKDATDILATWAAKTAAVRGLVDRKTTAVPPDHFSWIKEHLTPPPFTFIWLGRSEYKPGTLTRQLTFTLGLSGKPAHSHLTTIVIGHVAFFILGCKDKIGLEQCLSNIFYLNKNLTFQIWPTAKALQFEDLTAFPVEKIKELSSGKFCLSGVARPDF